MCLHFRETGSCRLPGLLGIYSAPFGCDITDAMTPTTGGCGPHCTVAADRLGRPREAHCGCGECHGGGLAPVRPPGFESQTRPRPSN